MQRESSIVSIFGALGTEQPCFLFGRTFRTALPVEGKHLEFSVRPYVDAMEVIAFDGLTGVVNITRRADGIRAIIRMRKHHMENIGANTDQIIKPDLAKTFLMANPTPKPPAPETPTLRSALWPISILLGAATGVGLLLLRSKR